MKLRLRKQFSVTAAITFLIFNLAIAVVAVVAQPNTGNLDAYTRTDPPAGWTGGPPGGGWIPTAKGSGSPFITVPANGSLYIGFINGYVMDNSKELGVEVQARNPGDAKNFLRFVRASGNDNNGQTVGSISPSFKASFWTGLITANVNFSPQPAWEWLELKNTAATSKEVKILCAGSRCSKSERTTGGNGVSDSQMDFTNSMWGAENAQAAPMHITEVELYPRNVDLDLAVAPSFNAPPHTGNWTAEFSFLDPAGDPRPRGGVRWVSDGPGLVAGEFHDLSLTMTGAADSSYLLFGFDADVGSYQEFFVDLRDTPWYEDFETHNLDIGGAGWRGWKGWDDDLAFDAVISNQQARNGAHAVRIEDNSDLVREYDVVDEGTWSYTAWQYIPSDFTSGGQGPFSGTYFILLNTYNDGGPYHWSVQMQFDSNDGLLKVLHGDSTNSVDVPYETDRWVKIQAIIDLEDDWTRIYYDDELVTEYSWTGGVLGNGGGLTEIQAVDLFANGSSPVFYDDLSLEPLPLREAPIQDITPITGNILSGGIPELQQSDDQVLHTRSGFGQQLIDLHNLTIDVGAQAQGGNNTIDITVESRIDQPAGVATLLLKNWTTQRFESVGAYPIGDTEETQTFSDIVGKNYIRDGDNRIELRVKQSVFVPYLAFQFESFFDVVRIDTR